ACSPPPSDCPPSVSVSGDSGCVGSSFSSVPKYVPATSDPVAMPDIFRKFLLEKDFSFSLLDMFSPLYKFEILCHNKVEHETYDKSIYFYNQGGKHHEDAIIKDRTPSFQPQSESGYQIFGK